MLGDAARKEADDAVVNAMILFLNAKITKLYQMAIYSSIFGSFSHYILLGNSMKFQLCWFHGMCTSFRSSLAEKKFVN